MKSIRDSKQLYWGLIITFFVLYFCVGFVSTLHSITFFELANSMWMAVLLGITYEVGQASVLFSILMTKNAQKLLPWLLMFLLTALQVTANVYASFKFMDMSGSNDWTFWQRSILFWMETDSPEMFKVVISWITGALLPIVALGMTALVAENLKLKDEENQDDPEPIDPPDDPLDELGVDDDPKWKVVGEDERINPMEDYIKEQIDNDPTSFDDISKHIDSTIQEDLKKIKEQEADPSGVEPVVVPSKTERLTNFAEELLNPKNQLKFPPDAKTPGTPGVVEVVKQPIEIDLNPTDDGAEPFPLTKFSESEGIADKEYIEKVMEDNTFKEGDFSTDPNTGLFPKKPVNNKRGWHLQKEFTDENGDVYHFGQYQPEVKILPPKKAKG